MHFVFSVQLKVSDQKETLLLQLFLWKHCIGAIAVAVKSCEVSTLSWILFRKVSPTPNVGTANR
ncbi:hypothetical protein DNTS_010275 [Danionella cerebrum]|uniref:Uncharacterized protein n=1 Tax=Danionella cerebrum TaxID=2873325 RepID=A0A553MRA2_9TELE|nr:hypothetical protein DNTS_010275 [Danionella translucida]